MLLRPCCGVCVGSEGPALGASAPSSHTPTLDAGSPQPLRGGSFLLVPSLPRRAPISSASAQDGGRRRQCRLLRVAQSSPHPPPPPPSPRPRPPPPPRPRPPSSSFLRSASVSSSSLGWQSALSVCRPLVWSASLSSLLLLLVVLVVVLHHLLLLLPPPPTSDPPPSSPPH